MLIAARRKVFYLLAAALLALTLLAGPSFVPAIHADCQPVGSPQCGG